VPGTNPTTPSEAVLSVTNSVNGTIRFVIADPVVRPIGTRFQIIRSLVSTNAAAGTVVYEGLTQAVDLPSVPVVGFYFSRAYANSYYGPYSPNTLGLTANAYFTQVTQVNCSATQVFSGDGALHVTQLGRVDFAPSSADAVVSVTAAYRTGLQNINAFQNIRIQFVTGVTSFFLGDSSIPVGGNTTNMQPVTQTAVFTYTRGNSAYVNLYWDVASGANSFTLDQVSLRTEFIRL
jgi:hypothetical protein